METLNYHPSIRIVCREATSEQLIARLATPELDVVLSDSPADRSRTLRAYNHLLGESGMDFVGIGTLVKKKRGTFSKSLSGGPDATSHRQHGHAARSRLLV